MKRVYIGLDLGWRSIRYEARTKKNELINRGGIPATPDDLRKLLEKFEQMKPLQVAFEAGSQMYWVNQVINEVGIDSYPFHAKSFVEIVKSKKKTDKKDAQKIAINAVKDNLPPRVVVAEGTEKKLRELLKEREVRKQDINALVNQLHALAIRTGIRLEQKSGLSQDPEKWKSAIDRLEAGSQAQANRLYLLALSLFQVLEEIEEEIKVQVNQKEEYGQIRLRLQKQPGIGFWTAVALLAWSGKEAERFPTPRQAASYFGLVTATRQSGDQKRLGKITKEGPPLVRRLMVQSAWAFVRSKKGRASRWGQWFLKEVERRPNQKKILIVALARKLVTAAIACLKNHTHWDNRVLDQEKKLEKVESQHRKKKCVPVKPQCGRENYGSM